MSPTFTPPTYDEQVSDYGVYGYISSLWSRISIPTGITVWRSGGSWNQRVSPESSDLEAADALDPGDTSETYNGRLAFLGGHTYIVSSAVAASLNAAGYTTS